jgi:hypothetical protein
MGPHAAADSRSTSVRPDMMKSAAPMARMIEPVPEIQTAG